MKVMKKIKSAMYVVWSLIICNIAFATNYIPTSSDDHANSSEDFSATIMRIFVNDVIPVIELVGSAILIYFGVRTIISTVQDYRRDKEMGTIFEGLIILTIIFAIGAGVFYLFDAITV